MRTSAGVVFLLGAAFLAGLCLLWPMLAAVLEVFSSATWSDALLTGRQWGLFGRGVWVAVAAATLAQFLGAGLAVGLVRGSRMAPVVRWVALAVLLTPPYVYAYAWSLPLLPEGLISSTVLEDGWRAALATHWRAVWCLGCWTAPVAGFVLAGGWRCSGRPAAQLALQDAGLVRAVLRAGLPVMGPWVAVSLSATGILALTEYSVCHLCLVQVWNTEILAEVQRRSAAGGALLLAWPLLALVALLGAAGWPFRRRVAGVLDDLAGLRDAIEPSVPRRSGRSSSIVLAAACAGLLLLPIVLLVAHLRDVAALGTMWRIFPSAWRDGLLVALGCVAVSLWIAVGVDFALAAPRRFGWGAWGAAVRNAARLAVCLAAFWAVAPPALVGDAFAAAFVEIPIVYDHWPIVSFVSVARFALVAIIALRLTARLESGTLTDVAAADSAGWTAAYFRVRLPLARGALVAAGVIVGVLSLTEVSASFLVKPPGLASVSVTLLNEIHYGRRDDVIALSVYVMVFVGAVVLLLREGRSARQLNR